MWRRWARAPSHIALTEAPSSRGWARTTAVVHCSLGVMRTDAIDDVLRATRGSFITVRRLSNRRQFAISQLTRQRHAGHDWCTCDVAMATRQVPPQRRTCTNALIRPSRDCIRSFRCLLLWQTDIEYGSQGCMSTGLLCSCLRLLTHDISCSHSDYRRPGFKISYRRDRHGTQPDPSYSTHFLRNPAHQLPYNKDPTINLTKQNRYSAALSNIFRPMLIITSRSHKDTQCTLICSLSSNVNFKRWVLRNVNY